MGIDAINPFLNYQQPRVNGNPFGPQAAGGAGAVQPVQPQVQQQGRVQTQPFSFEKTVEGIDRINANQDIFSALNEAQATAGYTAAGTFDADSIFLNSKDGEHHPKIGGWAA